VNRIPRLGLAACALVIVATVAACGSSGGSKSTPQGTPLTDPTEIITLSAASVQGVTSLHLDIDVSGSINASAIAELIGTSSGSLPGKLSLDDTSVTGDFDLVHQAYRLSLSAPRLFSLTAEAIQVDGYQYTSMSGGKYTKTEATTPLISAAPSATLDIAGQIASLRKSLDDMGATSTLAGTEKVDGKDAYHIKILIPVSKINDQLKALGESTASVTLDSLDVDYWALAGSLRPARITVAASSSQLGNISAVVNITKYNESVDIKAPSADQIAQ
jgi:hypothetical protein